MLKKKKRQAHFVSSFVRVIHMDMIYNKLLQMQPKCVLKYQSWFRYIGNQLKEIIHDVDVPIF